jgi:hypothetical protein
MIDGDMLAGGGGPPHDPGMEMRVQRLEDALQLIEGHLASLDGRLRTVEITIAEMNGRLTNLPSTWAMITAMLGGQIAFAGTIAAILHLSGMR